MDEKKLSQLLSEKIEALVTAYSHLKDENAMLRDELQTTKAVIAQHEMKLADMEDNAGIKESEIEAIIEKLESALHEPEEMSLESERPFSGDY